MSHGIIDMPGANETLRVKDYFLAIAGIPVVGCIDCIHIAIKKPPNDRSEIFKNRKGVFTFKNTGSVGATKYSFSILLLDGQLAPTEAKKKKIHNSHLCVEMQDGILMMEVILDALTC